MTGCACGIHSLQCDRNVVELIDLGLSFEGFHFVAEVVGQGVKQLLLAGEIIREWLIISEGVVCGIRIE